MGSTPPPTAHVQEPVLAAGRRASARDDADPRVLPAGRPTGNAWARTAGVAGALARFTVLPAVESRAPRAAAGADPSRRFDAVLALSRALEARDPFIHLHSDRVGDLAARLGGELGWPADRISLLRQAALVHDIGKIGIPDAILLKTGPLAAEEWNTMQRHASEGADIVAGILTAGQTAWVRGHHERWDGRGYPDRLARHAIPQGAQILALADSFDAMTSMRTYRARMPAIDAIEECRRQRGSQFAPRVVDALFRLARRGEVPGVAPPETGGVVPALFRSGEPLT